MTSPAAHLPRFASVLKQLPAVQHAFAYGSGAFHQPGLYDEVTGGNQLDQQKISQQHASSEVQATSAKKSNKPMVDFILAVDEPLAWHKENIRRNPDHYSWVAKLGPEAVVTIADHVGVGIHFNTLVPMGDQMVKYGVLSCEALEDDLRTWRCLYTAGRLQKPVVHLVSQRPSITEAQQGNLHAAAAAALLLLPPTFTTQELLTQVVGLSYMGDIRVGLAEDPHKDMEAASMASSPSPSPSSPNQGSSTAPGSNSSSSKSGAPSSSPVQHILSTVGSSEGRPPLHAVAEIQLVSSSGDSSSATWRQAIDPSTRQALFTHLPPALMVKVSEQLGFHPPESHMEFGSPTKAEMAWAAVKTGNHRKLLAHALHRTVRSSSLWQAASGLLAAGGGKTVEYVGAKVMKVLRQGSQRVTAISKQSTSVWSSPGKKG